MLYWFVRIITGLLVRLFFVLDIKGRENLPLSGAYIIASNHRSNLDPVILAASIERKLFFLAKAELFENRIAEFLLQHLNCIRLRRSGEDKPALRQGLKALRSGKVLLLFPEGTRSKNKRLGRGKTGLSLFAFAAKVPVVPVFVTGTEKALPIGARRIHHSIIRVVFGKPVRPKKDIDCLKRKTEYRNFVDNVMESISAIEEKSS
jgi:1-acyl-sn-glycerol-3-phosphate acyltransferase